MPHTEAPPTNPSLFFAPDGLRPGWSLLLFLLLSAFLLAILTTAYQALGLGPKTTGTPHPVAPIPFLLWETLTFLLLAFAAWIMSRIERRPFGAYGLGGPRRLPDLLAGLAWGLLALSLLVGTLHTLHLLAFDTVALHGRPALLYGAKWAFVFLAVGFQEEFLTRGYIQYTLARGLRAFTSTHRHPDRSAFWIAAVLFSALLFMALHLRNRGETPIGILAVGAAGLTFAFSLWRTGTLWWAIGFHTAWDWAQSFLYGVADSGGMIEGRLLITHPTGAPWLSGGTTGPEGSIFVLPTLLLVCLVIHRTLPERPDPTAATPPPLSS